MDRQLFTNQRYLWLTSVSVGVSVGEDKANCERPEKGGVGYEDSHWKCEKWFVSSRPFVAVYFRSWLAQFNCPAGTNLGTWRCQSRSAHFFSLAASCLSLQRHGAPDTLTLDRTLTECRSLSTYHRNR